MREGEYGVVNAEKTSYGYDHRARRKYRARLKRMPCLDIVDIIQKILDNIDTKTQNPDHDRDSDQERHN